jgi:hypothetical protein
MDNADTVFTWTPPSTTRHVQLRMIQDGVGGRGFTLPGSVFWIMPEPTWNTAIGMVNIITAFWDGTNFWLTGGAQV